MSICKNLSVVTAVCAIFTAASALAGDLSNFNEAIEKVAAHNRVATNYLRTGNADLAAIELDDMRGAWSKLTKRFEGKTPDAFADNALYSDLLQNTAGKIDKTLGLIDSGDLPGAAKETIDFREKLSAMRRASGLYLLADCVLDANKAMDDFFVYKTNLPQWGDKGVKADVQSKAAIYGYLLHRCDAMATPAVKADPEFRRLVDGAHNGLSFVPQAVSNEDSGQLFRVLIELRSFDNLLFFRFG
ncbi:MAG: hypothetical protein J0G28_12065 [Afipia sp.]|nr:hypothetical protein [Afipia sp.]OJW64568.1 MAG: hypothetical protein BGO65_16780 [Afipia sp. 64-13]